MAEWHQMNCLLQIFADIQRLAEVNDKTFFFFSFGALLAPAGLCLMGRGVLRRGYHGKVLFNYGLFPRGI